MTYRSVKKSHLAGTFMCLSIAAFLVVLTQIYRITQIPGFHFDEAWQAYYAWRIATESGFWPTQAMNSYTWPVVHYLLAGVFKIFGPSILVERLFYATLQWGAALLLSRILWVRTNKVSAIIFLFLWATMPYFVHTHRFYVEMTGLFVFCFALGAFGLHIIESHFFWGAFTVLISSVLGVYSHILYISVVLSGVWLWLNLAINKEYTEKFPLVNRLWLLCFSTLCACTIPALRMHLHFGRRSTLILCAIIICMIFLVIAAKFSVSVLFESIQQGIKKILQIVNFLFCAASFPFLPAFIFLLWEGPWNYAQSTGYWHLWFLLPINSVFLIFALRFFFKSKENDFYHSIFWAFLYSFVFSSAIIFKQSPRYYTIPSTILLMAVSISLSRLPIKQLFFLIVPVFIWNSYLYLNNYIDHFSRHGARDDTYKFFIYKDSPRDMRPFQKVFQWLEQQGCLLTLDGVENDRFLFPLKFYQVQHQYRPRKNTTSDYGVRACPWKNFQLAFRTIPKPHDQTFPGNLKILHHEASWGDLAIWQVIPAKDKM